MAAAIGCVVYGLLPYHLGIDWGLRQAAGEFAAYAFLPLVALGQMDWLSRGRPGLAFPLGLAGIILCHLPTALLAAHVFGVIALVWALAHPRAALPLLAGLAGMGLAGLYWLPAMVLLGDVSPEALYTQFHQPQMWLLPMDGPMPNPGMTLLSVCTALAGAVVCLIAIAFTPRGERHMLWLWTALPIVIVLFLNSRASAPIWDHWVIDRVQFPFRLFVLSDLATALAAAALARHLFESQPRVRRVIAALSLSTLALCALVGLHLAGGRIANGIEVKGANVRMIALIEYHPPRSPPRSPEPPPSRATTTGASSAWSGKISTPSTWAPRPPSGWRSARAAGSSRPKRHCPSRFQRPIGTTCARRRKAVPPSPSPRSRSGAG